MHYHIFISTLAVLSASLPVYCLSNNHGNPITLSPINIKDFEATVGIQRRADVDFSDLDPATQARLIYGQPGGKTVPRTSNNIEITNSLQTVISCCLQT